MLPECGVKVAESQEVGVPGNVGARNGEAEKTEETNQILFREDCKALRALECHFQECGEKFSEPN